MSQKKLKRLKRESLVLEKIEGNGKVDGIIEIIRKNWQFILVVLLTTVLIYINAMKGDFVSDDYATIPQNPQIMSFKHGLSGWMGGLINWFLAINFGIKSPISYHLTSLLLYLMVIVAAFVLVELVFKNNLISKVSTFVFAVLPIHVEAVSWIAGRPYLLNALFILISLNLFILYTKTETKKYIWLFLLFVFLTFAAEKTRSTALPLLILAYWLSFDNSIKKKINTGKILFFLGAFFTLIVLVLWPQMLGRIRSVNSGINASDSIFYNPFFQYPTSMAKYLQLIFVPIDLTLYHTMYTSPVWLNWVIFLLYLAAVVWFWFKDKKYFFALIFIFAAAAPSMAPVKISWLVAERYMFLGSLGGAILLSLLAEKYWNKRYLTVIGLSIILAFYSVRVILRNTDWQTNHNLWVNTCQVSPNSHNAWNNIGDDYDKLAQLETTDQGKLKQYENAIKGFAQSFAIKPNYADAYHNQANILYKMGRLDLARQAYELALYYNPDLYQTYLTLIQLDMMEMNKVELQRHVENAIRVKPNDLQTYYMSAVAYAKVGLTDQAKKIADMLYQQVPNIKEIKDLYDSLNTPNKNLESGTGTNEQLPKKN